jgi:hypothetical protein
MKSRFIYIILAIILVLLINPFIQQAGKAGHFLAILFVTLIPLSSFYALTEDRRRGIIIIFIAIPFVILDTVNLFLANRFLMVVVYSFGTILYFYIIVLLVKTLLSYRVITADLVYCAISTYLLIGIMWTALYALIEGISPGSFSGISKIEDLLYFSFVTLTTVGYGDITPQTILSKRLAVFEAAMGGIYMAVIIAMIVGRYMSMQTESDSNDKGISEE